MTLLLPLERAPRRARRRPSFWRALTVNIRIIGALMMREGTTRYGHENLGFFWVMGEPLVLTVGVMGMWTITGAGHGHGIGIVPFALTGYALLTLWRHLTGKFVRLIRQNAGLLFHRNVRLLDIFLARAMLEILGIGAAFTIAYIPLAMFGLVPVIHDPLVMVGALLLEGWFAFSCGLIIAAVSEISEAVEQFVPPILYITLPFTGSFYMAAWLPQKWRELILWSPLVNAQEMFRSGIFPVAQETYWSASYLVFWSAALTAIGIPLVQSAQKRVSLQ